MSDPNSIDTTVTARKWSKKSADKIALFPLTQGGMGTAYPLSRASHVLGRSGSDSATVTFDDSRMSRAHSEISQLSTGVYSLHDLGSKNGTWHNGEPASGNVIGYGDVIRVGDTVLAVGRYNSGVNREKRDPLIGRSVVMQQVREAITRLARSELTVFIHGPTGTGKELVAQELHAQSRRKGPLIAVNCAAISPQLAEREFFGHARGAYTGATTQGAGYIDAAQGGTLFLDEIGDLPLELQAKLLRFLEDRSYVAVGSTKEQKGDVRVIAATHRDLRKMVRGGKFREDLFARLDEAAIEIPALRGRLEDLPLLIAHFQEASEQRFAVTADAMEALALHDWPRNVRELRKLVRRLPFTQSTELLDLDDLPGPLQEPLLRRFDVDLPTTSGATVPSLGELKVLLSEHNGNVSKVATALDCDRKQVYRWLKRYDLDPSQFRDD